MKKSLPIWLLPLVGVVGGLLVGRWEIVAISVVLLVAALGVQFAKRGPGERQTDPLDLVSNESRSRLAPIRNLRNDIQDLYQKNSGSMVVKVMGAEAMDEAERLVKQSVDLINLRDKLQKTLYQRPVAERAIAEAESMADGADDATKDALQSALDARKLELSHYLQAEDGVKKIDACLAQAVAALSEMKTRLSMAAAGQGEIGQDNMRETLSRMRSLSASFDEAEAFLNETT